MVFLTMGDQMLKAYRVRDFVEARVVEGPYDADFLVVISEAGGPGTCIWARHAEVFIITSAGDEGVELHSREHVELGGYLGCTDGLQPACGCGSWEADFDFIRRSDATLMQIRPRVRERDANAAPAPAGETFRL